MKQNKKKQRVGYRYCITYFCPKCDRCHHNMSHIGKAHWKYRQR